MDFSNLRILKPGKISAEHLRELFHDLHAQNAAYARKEGNNAPFAVEDARGRIIWPPQ